MRAAPLRSRPVYSFSLGGCDYGEATSCKHLDQSCSPNTEAAPAPSASAKEVGRVCGEHAGRSFIGVHLRPPPPPRQPAVTADGSSPEGNRELLAQQHKDKTLSAGRTALAARKLGPKGSGRETIQISDRLNEEEKREIKARKEKWLKKALRMSARSRRTGPAQDCHT